MSVDERTSVYLKVLLGYILERRIVSIFFQNNSSHSVEKLLNGVIVIDFLKFF